MFSITVRNKHLLRVSIALSLSTHTFLCIHKLPEKLSQLPLYTKQKDFRIIAPLKSVTNIFKVNKIKNLQLLMIIIIINNYNKE